MNLKKSIGASLLIASSNVIAGGIPTVDVANLVQNVMNYTQDLKAFSENSYQSTIAANEYIQTLKDWQQTLEEWDSQIEQMKSIKGQIDEGDWAKIVGDTSIGFPLNPMDPYWDNWSHDKIDNNGAIDIKNRVDNFHRKNRTIGEITDDIKTIYNNKPESLRDLQIEKARRNKSWIDEQIKYTAFLERGMDKKIRNINELQKKTYDTRIKSMGDETELRTLETISLQNEVTIEILKAQLDMETHAKKVESVGLYKKERALDREYDFRIRRMKERHEANPITPNSNSSTTVNF